jgi:hypothetical protein
MAYVAIKDFDGYKAGDTIKSGDVSERLVRAKKIQEVEGKAEKAPKAKKEKVQEVVQVAEVAETVEEELLVEDSAEVTVEVEGEEE